MERANDCLRQDKKTSDMNFSIMIWTYREMPGVGAGVGVGVGVGVDF